MDLKDTEIVKAGDVRPARPDGTCFYCRAPVGSLHEPSCVIVSRTVVVRFTVEAVVQVPHTWDKHKVEFLYNESSSCSDNILRNLGEWTALEGDDKGCSCGAVKGEFVREASAQDHDNLVDLSKLVR